MSDATPTTRGFMSAADKVTLDGLAAESGVPSSRLVSASTGLTGGGDLSADRLFACDFGTAAGKVCQGNDSRLSDARTPLAHAAAHKTGGSDALKLNELAVPTASVDFSGQQATSFRIENRTTDPTSPTTGQIWLRTDL